VSLAKKAVLGAIWSIGSSIGSMMVGLVSTVVLTNLLAPQVIGEVMVALVVVQTAGILSSTGVGHYLVSNPKAGPEYAFHAAMFHNTLGLLAIGVVLAAKDVVAPLSGAPGSVHFIPGFALVVALDRFLFIPTRLLVRDMRFGVLGVMNTAGELAYAGVAIATAWMGWGGDAIVAGNLIRTILQLVIVFSASKLSAWAKPYPIDREITKKLLRFGLPLTPASILHYGAMKWDNVMMSRFFGPAIAGIYSRAYNFADIPANKIGEQIGDVLVPSFAHMDDQGDRKRALVRSVGLMALVITPLAVGLGAVAHTLVDAIFKDRWADVAPMLVILSALSVVRPIGWLIMGYLQAQNRTRTIMVLEAVKVAALLACIALLAMLGPLWACAGVGVGFGLHAVASLWVVHRVDGMPMWAMTAPMLGPLAASVPMAAAVWGVRAALEGTMPSAALLLVEVVVGGAVYVPCGLLFARSTSRDLLQLLRKVRGRAAAEAPAT
jgi:PST family polysaccharide transporter